MNLKQREIYDSNVNFLNVFLSIRLLFYIYIYMNLLFKNSYIVVIYCSQKDEYRSMSYIIKIIIIQII